MLATQGGKVAYVGRRAVIRPSDSRLDTPWIENVEKSPAETVTFRNPLEIGSKSKNRIQKDSTVVHILSNTFPQLEDFRTCTSVLYRVQYYTVRKPTWMLQQFCGDRTTVSNYTLPPWTFLRLRDFGDEAISEDKSRPGIWKRRKFTSVVEAKASDADQLGKCYLRRWSKLNTSSRTYKNQ